MVNKNEILLVVNPISGSLDKNELINMIQQELDQRNINLHIYKTTGKEDNKNISEKLDELRPERVLVAGGDGTIQLVADVMVNKEYEVIIGILPAGSANGLAVNLMIPLERIQQLEIALGPVYQKSDILKLNGKTCLHLADLGINAELIRNYDESKIRGKFGYFLQTLPTLIKSEYPFDFKVETNDTSITQKGVLLAIANANKFGTGANINPDGVLDDGKFEILIFKNLDIVEIFKTLREENTMDPDFVEIICTNHAKITCTSKVPFQIDGEYLGEETEVDACLCDKQIQIAVPQEYKESRNKVKQQIN